MVNVSAHEISHHIVVVAGASHNLAHPPMPLMTEWVNSLITDLESEDPFLASQIGLERDLPGPEVESRIGDFLADALGAGRSNISNHLACLRGCGLVRTQREGRQVRYELASPRLSHALDDLVDVDLDVEEHHPDLDGRG